MKLNSAPYPLDAAEMEFYRANQFVKLSGVFSPEEVAYFSKAVAQRVSVHAVPPVPMEERSTYDRAFIQVMNLWRESESVRELVFSSRMARIAAAS